MLDFVYRWFPKADTARLADDDEQCGLPFPVTERSKGKKLYLQPIAPPISPPIPSSFPQSLTGFDSYHGQWQHPSPTTPGRAGPSNVAWLSTEPDEDSVSVTLPRLAPPAVIRVSSQPHIHPIGRSVSSPPTSPSYDSSSSSSSFSGVPSPKWNLRLDTNPIYSQSTHSLRLDSHPYTTGTDLFGYAYNYPLAKQLSPIAEQDYFSPESLRRPRPLPSCSEINASSSISYSYTNPSPGGSQSSEITRPSPSYSHPFISRQLNRTISQTSSRTQVSTAPSISKHSPQSPPAPPPSIPPLNLSPPFPGPHPGQNGNGPQLRPRRSAVVAMPTITGSSGSEGYIEDHYRTEDDLESLHAESFVTASDAIGAESLSTPIMEPPPVHFADARSRTISMPSVHSGRSRPSASESFISRRWDRDASLGSGVVRFRAKRQWITATPAFWAFWLGFICPFLWLIGGWHFTRFGEQPPRLTFWEFYFNAAYWKEKLCTGKRRKPKQDIANIVASHPLPKWVAEKQSSDDGRARLNDPKRSLRGISFGYPFIPRPVQLARRCDMPWNVRMAKHIIRTLQKPNRLFDHFYGVKLREVRGRPESGRRMFDPWIQRCRYAFCYALILLCVGLCTSCTYLIIYNTRQLR